MSEYAAMTPVTDELLADGFDSGVLFGLSVVEAFRDTERGWTAASFGEDWSNVRAEMQRLELGHTLRFDPRYVEDDFCSHGCSIHCEDDG